MFAGESSHTLDEKNRLVIPRRILDALEKEEDRERFYVTRGIEGCLYLVPAVRFEGISANLGGRSFQEKGDARRFKRLLFSKTQLVFLDAQNRILLPDALKAEAEIDREVVVVGVGDRVEVWSAPRWQAFQEAMNPRFDELADLLEGGPPGTPPGTPGDRRA